MHGLPGLDPRLAARADAAAAWLRGQGDAGVLVVHHIDADGVTAGAIAQQALARAGIPHTTLPVKSLDDHHVALVQAQLPRALWFCDLGSAAHMRFAPTPRLVCDHHQLVRDGTEESFPHVNPLLDGLEGHTISGAGCAFLVALALDPANADLAPLALVGAAGDRQDRPAYTGANAAILALAERHGLAEARQDLAFFGPATRPVRKFLLSGEPAVPGLTGEPKAVDRLLRDAGVDAGAATGWLGLDESTRAAVRTAVLEHLLDVGLASRAPALLRPVVTFPREPDGPTREAQEFATFLNGTARYGRSEVGIAVACGDRGEAYQEALGLLADHRRHLVGALDALARRPIVTRRAVQHVHMEDTVLDTVVGIVAGMALGGDMGLRQDMPLVAFAFTPDGRTKASSRAPQELHARGIDLSQAMAQGAAAVGGQGGGHKGAAGATIPRGTEAAFLEVVDRLVAGQLGVTWAEPAPSQAATATGQATGRGALDRTPPAGATEGVPNLLRRPGQQAITSF